MIELVMSTDATAETARQAITVCAAPNLLMKKNSAGKIIDMRISWTKVHITTFRTMSWDRPVIRRWPAREYSPQDFGKLFNQSLTYGLGAVGITAYAAAIINVTAANGM